jgi:hypothetical protein
MLGYVIIHNQLFMTMIFPGIFNRNHVDDVYIEYHKKLVFNFQNRTYADNGNQRRIRMNLFRYLCPSCGGFYNDVIENGKSKLLHRGLNSSSDPSKLPTPQCIPSHDYVVFEHCGHCCPEIFAECRACKLGYPGTLHRPGHPSVEACYCHYCVEDSELNLANMSSEAKKDQLKMTMENNQFDLYQ